MEKNKVLAERISIFRDQKSLSELIKMFYAKLYRISFSVLKNKMLAEEAVADVFFRIWQMGSQFKDVSDINKYLCTSAKNNALVLLKKETKISSNILLDIDDDFKEMDGFLAFSISPEGIYLTEELKKCIEIAISNLPERCKEVFSLIKEEGLSYKDTAERLKIKPKTVENQLAIALKKIHAELKPYLKTKK